MSDIDTTDVTNVDAAEDSNGNLYILACATVTNTSTHDQSSGLYIRKVEKSPDPVA